MSPARAHWPSSVLCLLLLTMVAPPASARPGLAQAKATANSTRESSKDRIDGEPIAAGFLILDGQYVPPPYRISEQGHRIWINDCELLPSRRQREADSEEQESFGGMPGPAPRRLRLERELAQGMLLVLAADGTFIEYPQASAFEILSLLCSTQSRDEQLVHLLQSGQGFDSLRWARVLDRFQPNDELRSRMEAMAAELQQQYSGIEIVHDGSSRTPIYVLTVVGMILVVLSFGVVLSFRPHAGAGSWRELDHSEAAVGLVARCIILTVALSSFDLLCTLLAQGTGKFMEINPMADALLSSPQVLIGFKLAMTAIAGLILWRLRYYRGTQIASWWICLLLTVLTVRWVAVESLLMA